MGDAGVEEDLNTNLFYRNNKGVKFALSNVMEHKGLKNEILIEWANKYNIHNINFNYKNSSYHGKNNDKRTVEVLITNY